MDFGQKIRIQVERQKEYFIIHISYWRLYEIEFRWDGIFVEGRQKTSRGIYDEVCHVSLSLIFNYPPTSFASSLLKRMFNYINLMSFGGNSMRDFRSREI